MYRVRIPKISRSDNYKLAVVLEPAAQTPSSKSCTAAN